MLLDGGHGVFAVGDGGYDLKVAAQSEQ